MYSPKFFDISLNPPLLDSKFSDMNADSQKGGENKC